MGEGRLRKEYQHLVEGFVCACMCVDVCMHASLTGLQRAREERETDVRLANPSK